MWEIVYDKCIKEWGKSTEWYEFKIGPIGSTSEISRIVEIIVHNESIGNINVRRI